MALKINFTEEDIRDLQEAFDTMPGNKKQQKVFEWSITRHSITSVDSVYVEVTVGEDDE